MGSEMEVTSCNKNKGKKICFSWSTFITDCITAYKWQKYFMEVDFEADKPRMKAELKVMVAEF